MTGGITRSLTGTILYTSEQSNRRGAERGREHFRMDVHADGSRTIGAHSEIDDAPAVVRDVDLRLDASGAPQESFVRIAIGGKFRGSGWFRFAGTLAECEAFTSVEGRISQRMSLEAPLPAFGNHAIVNDGYMTSLYDVSKGTGRQVTRGILLSSPDHRGATGPMLFPVDLAMEYAGEEDVAVEAGRFRARHFRVVDVPGMPLEHPAYDLWVTADADNILLKAAVGGYMQTAYELVKLEYQER